MGRLISGISIILFVIVVGLFNAFVQTGTASGDGFGEDCSGDNATACAEDAQSRGDFLDTLRAATIEPFPGAPDFINTTWALVGITLLTAGILLVVFSFIPLTSE